MKIYVYGAPASRQSIFRYQYCRKESYRWWNHQQHLDRDIIDSLDSFPFYDEHKVKRKKSLVEELQGPTEEEIRQEQRKSILRRTAFGFAASMRT